MEGILLLGALDQAGSLGTQEKPYDPKKCKLYFAHLNKT
jgi:hypothetical protein